MLGILLYAFSLNCDVLLLHILLINYLGYEVCGLMYFWLHLQYALCITGGNDDDEK